MGILKWNEPNVYFKYAVQVILKYGYRILMERDESESGHD